MAVNLLVKFRLCALGTKNSSCFESSAGTPGAKSLFSVWSQRHSIVSVAGGLVEGTAKSKESIPRPFILNSFTESTSLNVLEAMSCNLPSNKIITLNISRFSVNIIKARSTRHMDDAGETK